MKTLVLSLLALLVGGVSTQSATVLLTPAADTFIAQTYPDKNFGAMAYFNSGTTQNYTTNRGLLRFDPGQVVPAGSKILSATLTFEVVGDPDEPWNTSHFELHRLLQDWGEGNNTASVPRGAGAAGPGEANWTHRFALTTATWGLPGGQAGVDYISTPSSATFVYQAGDPYTFNSTARLAGDLQLWLDQPSTNFGWMLILQNETDGFTARRFGSRESLSDTPLLEIEFQPPPTIEKFRILGDLIQFEFVSAAGFAHQVQLCDDLQTGLWQSSAPIGPYTNDTRVVVVSTLSGPQRFYRLKVF